MSDIRTQTGKAGREATASAADAANTAANASAFAARRGAETVEKSGSMARETILQGAEAAAELTRQAAQAGTETLRRSTEAVADTQRQIAQETAERLEDVSRTVAETARGTAEDIRTLIALPAVADRGLRELKDSVTGLVEGIVQTNLRATEELFRLANPIALIELQNRYVRDYMNLVMEGSAAIVRALRQTADQTLPSLEQHLRQRRQAQAHEHRAAAE
jgi:hypothetical protein